MTLTEAHKNIMFLLGQRSEDLMAAQHGKMGGVYVAMIAMDDEFSIEVEENPDTIIFSFMCSSCDAQALNEFLISELKQLGVHVYANHKEFEDRYYQE